MFVVPDASCGEPLVSTSVVDCMTQYYSGKFSKGGRGDGFWKVFLYWEPASVALWISKFYFKNMSLKFQ